MTLNSKLLNHIADHVTGICLLGASDSSRLIKMSLFLFVSVLILKKLKSDKKDPHAFELCKPHKLRVFTLSPTPKNENSETTETLQKLSNTEICIIKNN